MALLLWNIALWIIAWRKRSFAAAFAIELIPPVRSHYVQASVQFAIYAYWGWFWRDIYHQMPLILAQLVFLLTLDALLAWSRGRPWRPGFGPFPIVFSTNFFLWFRDDMFFAQFLMVASGALAKEFIRWRRDGRSTHIFNPSAFGLTLFSLILIVSGMTREWSWARELASTIDAPPHIYLVIFLLGLIVQFMFSVTLMTLAAAATLCLLNLIYTKATGTYYFITINISAAVFLGLHLLMTDPATSPKTLVGRVIFGSLYGFGIFICFGLLRVAGVPELYSKLLPVPILNLLTPLIERGTTHGFLGWLNRMWEGLLPRPKLNLIHMGLWAILFFTMLGTGFVQSDHPGFSISLWKEALRDGKPFAGDSLVRATLALSGRGSADATNELGVICFEGEIPGVEQSNARAARYFAQGSEAGSQSASANVAIQYLFLHQRRSDESVLRALAQLQLQAEKDPVAAFLVGYAYERGRGRPLDKARAKQFYRIAGGGDPFAAKGLARIGLTSPMTSMELEAIFATLRTATEHGDAEACWYLAYLYRDGKAGLLRSDAAAREWLKVACDQAVDPATDLACLTLFEERLPPYKDPVILRPPWVSAYPLSSAAPVLR